MIGLDLRATIQYSHALFYPFSTCWLHESWDLPAQTEKSSNYTKLDSDKSRWSPIWSEVVVLLPVSQNRSGTLIDRRLANNLRQAL